MLHSTKFLLKFLQKNKEETNRKTLFQEIQGRIYKIFPIFLTVEPCICKKLLANSFLTIEKRKRQDPFEISPGTFGTIETSARTLKMFGKMDRTGMSLCTFPQLSADCYNFFQTLTKHVLKMT